jgi:hypothetical protein
MTKATVTKSDSIYYRGDFSHLPLVFIPSHESLLKPISLPYLSNPLTPHLIQYAYNQYKCPKVNPSKSFLNKNFAAEVAFAPPQVVAPTQTLIPQQDATAQTMPAGQSLLVPHVCRPAQGVLPSTQNPVPSAVLAQTQVPPGPHSVNVSHVSPVHVLETQALLMQLPEGHC